MSARSVKLPRRGGSCTIRNTLRRTVDRLFNPFDPTVIANPYPSYQCLRTEDPVHRSRLGFWVLTRYDDCAMVLRDERFGRVGFEGYMEPAYTVLFKDPPDHTRLRALLNSGFTPRVVEGLRPHIRQIVSGLLDRAQAKGGMDVLADFAYPLAVTVISELLGVPERDHDSIKEWSTDIALGLEVIGSPFRAADVARGRTAQRALADYFRGLIPDRRKHRGSDLLSLLISAEERGDTLSEEELVGTCGILYMAGHETTVNLIGNGLLALLRHPAELQRLRDDPELIPKAVEELLRYDGPILRTSRVAHTDVEIDGRKIAKGAIVVLLLGAANRDPERFPDPDRLDVARTHNRHLAFGSGIHFCLGAPLARLEAHTAFDLLLARAPGLALATDKPEWRPSQLGRGLKALPVTF
jgi:pimeloyl-[acyl-carrier protein] synthase